MIELFDAMDIKSNNYKDLAAIRKCQSKFLMETANRTQSFTFGSPGESHILLQTLIQTLADDLQTNVEELSFTRLFIGSVSVIDTCSGCSKPEALTTSIDLPVHNVHGDMYKKENAQNLFKPRQITQRCIACGLGTVHSSVAEFEELPKILVIRIEHNEDTFYEDTPTLIESFTTTTSKDQVITYELCCATLDTSKQGFHTVALIKEGGEYYLLNDSYAKHLKSIEDIIYCPRNVFYVRKE